MLTGLNPISIVTELRLQHARGNKYAGVNVRKVAIDHRCARLSCIERVASIFFLLGAPMPAPIYRMYRMSC